MCRVAPAKRLRWRITCLVGWLLSCVPVVASAAEKEAPATLQIAVLSDLNSSYGTVGHHVYVQRAVAHIVRLEPDLVIITGDLVAGQLRNPADDDIFDEMWAAFHKQVSAPLAAAGIPLAVTPGNHDASALPAFANEREQFARQWQGRMTDLNFVSREGFPFRYAFRLADVLFVALDVTTTGMMDNVQFDWLESLLTRSEGHFRDVVVFSHLPIWPVAEGRLNEATRDSRLHSLLAARGVGAYLSGHHHAFYPGVADGIAYVSQACLGSGPRRLIGSASAREPRGFTLLELTGDQLRVASLKAPDFDTVVRWETLPREIVGKGMSLRRADLADVSVAPLSLDSQPSVAGNDSKADTGG